jgi:hypothetical protein
MASNSSNRKEEIFPHWMAAEKLTIRCLGGPLGIPGQSQRRPKNKGWLTKIEIAANLLLYSEADQSPSRLGTGLFFPLRMPCFLCSETIVPRRRG